MDLAQVFLVGELVSDPQQINYAKNEYYTDIQIRVARPFKSNEGVFVFDNFVISLWKGAGLDLKLSGKKGCTVCVSGRLETKSNNSSQSDGVNTVIVAEKCSFSV